MVITTSPPDMDCCFRHLSQLILGIRPTRAPDLAKPIPAFDLGKMDTFTIRHASVHHQQVIVDLVEEAATWLRGKGTDQWAKPWPDRRRRDGRIRNGLKLGETWIVWDGDTPAATMTICARVNPDVWPVDGDDDAVYVHRLVVSRPYSGLGLGGVMLDWAVQRESRTRDIRWLRVDVWSTNEGLHAYYERQGFLRCGSCADLSYPSGALFQKEARDALTTDTSRLVEERPFPLAAAVLTAAPASSAAPAASVGPAASAGAAGGHRRPA